MHLSNIFKDKNRRRVYAVAAATALGVVATASPAFAHRVDIYQGNDHGDDHGWIGQYHNNVFIIDGECDGHAATTDVWYAVNGYTSTESVWDDNGCSAGGSSLDVSTVSVVGIRVCEHTGSKGSGDLYCTAWNTNP